MGELSDSLKEFEQTTKEYYKRVMDILEDKYCWKCPMRTNKNVALCLEVEAWVRLTESMEGGINEVLFSHNLSLEKWQVITAKFLEKKMTLNDKKENNMIFKLEESANPLASAGDFLYVKTSPIKVKKDDLVLLPRICPLAAYWYSKTVKNMSIPFKLFKVARVYQENGYRHIQTEEGLQIPVDYLIGVVKKIIPP
jgi:hypothetical protein